MATTVDLPGTLESREPENRLELDAIARALELGSGSFHLIFVEYDLPHWRNHLSSELASRLHPKHIVAVDLALPPPDASTSLHVLDQLQAQLEVRSHGAPPDALLVTGLERLLPKAQDTFSSNEHAQLLRTLAPLNVGRNLLPQIFPYPLLLALPSDAMPLLEYAPDFRAWGGFYRLTSDRERVKEEIRNAAAAGAGFWERRRLRRRTADDLEAERNRLTELSADAEVLDTETTVRLQLDERLGWVSLALRNRGEAEAAFRRMHLLARNTGDEPWNKRAQRGLAALKRLGSSVAVRPQGDLAALPGAGAVTELGGLFGRDEEVREVLARIASEDPRMLIIWGETGSGKTSLLQAGVIARLREMPGYLTVLVHDWRQPIQNSFSRLEQVSQMHPAKVASLHERVEQAAVGTGQTIVIIFDQFEQFFAQEYDRRTRNEALRQIGTCITDVRLNCRVVFALRGDELTRMIELESYVPNVLEERKRFYLPLFETSAAIRALDQLASRANANWPPLLIENVVQDLQVDGRVRPVHLQLTASAMVLAGIDSKQSYNQAGRAQGLMADYLDLVLESLSENRRERDWMKRLLVALIDDDQKRYALAVDDIAKRSGLSLFQTQRLLVLLVKGKLVRTATGRAPSEGAAVVESYELMHDALLALIFGTTDQRVQANRLLRSALAKFRSRRFYTLSRAEQRLIESYADASRLKNPEVIRLRRRSSWYRFGRNLLPFLALLITYLGVLVCFRSFAMDQPDSLNRLVVRRGLPVLGWLPGESVVLDTGYNGNQLKPGFQQRGEWFWNLRTGDPLQRPSLANSLTNQNDVAARECLMDSDRCWSAVTNPSRLPVDLLNAAIEVYPERKWIEPALKLGVHQPGLPVLRLASSYPPAYRSILSATSSEDFDDAILGFQIAVRGDPALQEQCLTNLHRGDAYAVRDLLLAIRERPDLARRIYPDLVRAFDEFQSRKFENQGVPSALVPSALVIPSPDPPSPPAAAAAILAVVQAAPDLRAEAYPTMLKQLRDTSGEPWQFEFATVLLRNSYEPARVKEWLLRQWQGPSLVELDQTYRHRTAASKMLALVEVAKSDREFRNLLVKDAAKSQPYADEKSLAQGVVLLFGAATPDEAGRIAGSTWFDWGPRGFASWLIRSALTTPALAPVFKNACYEHFNNEIWAGLTSVYLYQSLLRLAPEYPRNPKHRGKDVFDHLLDSNPRYRAGAAYGLASILVQLAEKEPEPAKFLLDHLEAKRSIFPYYDANTLAPYRDAAASAIALWLNSDHPSAIREHKTLETQVRALMHDNRMYIRAAAWRAIDESATLMERRAREELELPW